MTHCFPLGPAPAASSAYLRSACAPGPRVFLRLGAGSDFLRNQNGCSGASSPTAGALSSAICSGRGFRLSGIAPHIFCL